MLTKTQSKRYSKWVLKQMTKTKDEMMEMKMTKCDHLRSNKYGKKSHTEQLYVY